MKRRPDLDQAVLIRINSKAYRNLKILAAEKSTTVSSIFRRALRYYLASGKLYYDNKSKNVDS